jgi:manganese/zinc/iron transport system permease protein
VFFGAGIVLLTHIQKLPLGNQSGLDKFLFGQAATLLPRDVMIMAALGGVVLLLVLLFFKELRVLSFDPEFGASIGFPMRGLEVFLTVLLVTVVVVGLQTVGVVLIVATLITPAAAARQWTDSLGVMVLLAAGIGGLSGAAGALISAGWARLPTGPVIVLVASAILLVSLMFAPQRGMLWASLRERAVAARIRRENLLKDLYRWGENSGGTWSEPVSTALVMGFRGHSRQQLSRVAGRVQRQGLLSWTDDGITLRPEGLEQAQRIVRRHRLWELYLTRRLELAEDHVHRDAEEMEHALTDETEAKLDALLGYPTVDPHGRPIPRSLTGRQAQRGVS